LATSHLALIPQAPMQGSPHLKLIQALFEGHSELMTHSGLQLGGGPMYPGRQEQASWPFITWQTALAPHGDGWHGTGIGVITGITLWQ
jgi:hypothetical protein